MEKSNALLIFTKNLVPGKVKTRLAATIGHEKALQVYKHLIEHTFSATRLLTMNKYVWYSDYAEAGDVWTEDYLKGVQKGDNLGERMSHAFKDAFRHGHKKVVIIGTDCPHLDETILKNAFESLSHADVVIGPAKDGGYYLLGMKLFYCQLFENIAWSTGTVFSDTIIRCGQLGLSYLLLPELNDIDNEKDLIETGLFQLITSP